MSCNTKLSTTGQDGTPIYNKGNKSIDPRTQQFESCGLSHNKKSFWSTFKEVTKSLLPFSDKPDDQRNPKIRPLPVSVNGGNDVNMYQGFPTERLISEGLKAALTQTNKSVGNLNPECRVKCSRGTDAPLKEETISLIKRGILFMYDKRSHLSTISGSRNELTKWAENVKTHAYTKTKVVGCWDLPVLNKDAVPQFLGGYVGEMVVHILSLMHDVYMETKKRDVTLESWLNLDLLEMLDTSTAIPCEFMKHLHRTKFIFKSSGIECKVAMNGHLFVDRYLVAPAEFSTICSEVLSAENQYEEDYVSFACKLIAKVLKYEAMENQTLSHSDIVELFCVKGPEMCLCIGKALVDLGVEAQLIFMNARGCTLIAAFDTGTKALAKFCVGTSAQVISVMPQCVFSPKTLIYLMVILKAHILQCYRGLWSSTPIECQKYPRLTRAFIHCFYKTYREKNCDFRMSPKALFENIWSKIRPVFLKAFLLDACESIQTSKRWQTITQVMRKCRELEPEDEAAIDDAPVANYRKAPQHMRVVKPSETLNMVKSVALSEVKSVTVVNPVCQIARSSISVHPVVHRHNLVGPSLEGKTEISHQPVATSGMLDHSTKTTLASPLNDGDKTNSSDNETNTTKVTGRSNIPIKSSTNTNTATITECKLSGIDRKPPSAADTSVVQMSGMTESKRFLLDVQQDGITRTKVKKEENLQSLGTVKTDVNNMHGVDKCLSEQSGPKVLAGKAKHGQNAGQASWMLDARNTSPLSADPIFNSNTNGLSSKTKTGSHHMALQDVSGTDEFQRLSGINGVISDEFQRKLSYIDKNCFSDQIRKKQSKSRKIQCDYNETASCLGSTLLGTSSQVCYSGSKEELPEASIKSFAAQELGIVDVAVQTGMSKALENEIPSLAASLPDEPTKNNADSTDRRTGLNPSVDENDTIHSYQHPCGTHKAAVLAFGDSCLLRKTNSSVISCQKRDNGLLPSGKWEIDISSQTPRSSNDRSETVGKGIDYETKCTCLNVQNMVSTVCETDKVPDIAGSSSCGVPAEHTDTQYTQKQLTEEHLGHLYGKFTLTFLNELINLLHVKTPKAYKGDSSCNADIIHLKSIASRTLETLVSLKKGAAKNGQHANSPKSAMQENRINMELIELILHGCKERILTLIGESCRYREVIQGLENAVQFLENMLENADSDMKYLTEQNLSSFFDMVQDNSKPQKPKKSRKRIRRTKNRFVVAPELLKLERDELKQRQKSECITVIANHTQRNPEEGGGDAGLCKNEASGSENAETVLPRPHTDNTKLTLLIPKLEADTINDHVKDYQPRELKKPGSVPIGEIAAETTHGDTKESAGSQIMTPVRKRYKTNPKSCRAKSKLVQSLEVKSKGGEGDQPKKEVVLSKARRRRQRKKKEAEDTLLHLDSGSPETDIQNSNGNQDISKSTDCAKGDESQQCLPLATPFKSKDSVPETGNASQTCVVTKKGKVLDKIPLIANPQEGYVRPPPRTIPVNRSPCRRQLRLWDMPLMDAERLPAICEDDSPPHFVPVSESNSAVKLVEEYIKSEAASLWQMNSEQLQQSNSAVRLVDEYVLYQQDNGDAHNKTDNIRQEENKLQFSEDHSWSNIVQQHIPIKTDPTSTQKEGNRRINRSSSERECKEKALSSPSGPMNDTILATDEHPAWNPFDFPDLATASQVQSTDIRSTRNALWGRKIFKASDIRENVCEGIQLYETTPCVALVNQQTSLESTVIEPDGISIEPLNNLSVASSTSVFLQPSSMVHQTVVSEDTSMCHVNDQGVVVCDEDGSAKCMESDDITSFVDKETGVCCFSSLPKQVDRETEAANTTTPCLERSHTNSTSKTLFFGLDDAAILRSDTVEQSAIQAPCIDTPSLSISSYHQTTDLVNELFNCENYQESDFIDSIIDQEIMNESWSSQFLECFSTDPLEIIKAQQDYACQGADNDVFHFSINPTHRLLEETSRAPQAGLVSGVDYLRSDGHGTHGRNILPEDRTICVGNFKFAMTPNFRIGMQ